VFCFIVGGAVYWVSVQSSLIRALFHFVANRCNRNIKFSLRLACSPNPPSLIDHLSLDKPKLVQKDTE
jgi:hypothetical protein